MFWGDQSRFATGRGDLRKYLGSIPYLVEVNARPVGYQAGNRLRIAVIRNLRNAFDYWRRWRRPQQRDGDGKGDHAAAALIAHNQER
jgi:hypothetical protein